MDRKYENILDFNRKDVLLQSEKRKSKMAKKSKDQRIQVILECTEQKTSGVPGMSRYITMKNKKNTPERLELKKFNPYLKKVTVHKEIK
jgi:large subunit ribosomal protein L33